MIAQNAITILMNVNVNVNAQTFYLPYQVMASLLLALVGVTLGALFAWIFWGHGKRKFVKLERENVKLKEKLELQ